jgi:hypothetical protein
MRVRLFVACALWASCTPIHAARRAGANDGGPNEVGMDAAVSDAGLNDAASADAAQPKTGAGTQKPADTCSTQGARACDGHASLTPLLCDGSHWNAQTPCKADERCDTSPGPNEGQCRPIASECMNREPAVPFCTGNQKRVCADLVSSELLPCPDQMQCVLTDGHAACACPTGSIPDGSTCREATSCTTEQGGCDPLTQCSMNGDQRVCSTCPAGYSGTGSQGCAPLLRTLTASSGTLLPTLTKDVTQYHLTVPLLTQRVTLTAEAPPNSRIEWNGALTASGTGWVSPVLKLGTNPLHLVVTSQASISSQYDVIVERTGVQDAYLKARMPTAGDSFGWGLAISGDTLVVGAIYEDSAAGGVNGDQSNAGAADSGAAYVFVRQGDTWVQQAYLKADSPAPNDFFGVSVAISGDTIAVGAPRADPWHGASGVTPRSGRVYVFTRQNGVWSQQARLAPAASAADDLVGTSVAVQGDTLVFGAPNDNAGAARSGAAYVYTRTAGTWAEGPKLKALKPVADGTFGSSLSIDANTLVIGAPYDSSDVNSAGSVDVFVLRDGKWLEQQSLRPPRPDDHGVFGQSVAVRGDSLVIGAPHSDLILNLPHGEIYTYERASDTWSNTGMMTATVPRMNDYFGSSLALTDTALLVGANGDQSGAQGLNGDPMRSGAAYEGAAYLYARQSQSYVLSAYIKAAAAEHDDAFGEWVAMSDDMVVVSAIYESGSVGGINGNQKDNSASKSGAVYVFR